MKLVFSLLLFFVITTSSYAQSEANKVRNLNLPRNAISVTGGHIIVISSSLAVQYEFGILKNKIGNAYALGVIVGIGYRSFDNEAAFWKAQTSTLIGARPLKIEITTGVLGTNSNGNHQQFRPALGIGYKYAQLDERSFFRAGIGTIEWLYFGVGISLTK